MTDKIKYKVVNGTSYHEKTPQAVIDVLERALQSHRSSQGEPIRVRLFLGDTETGRDWCEIYDIIGQIGASTGKVSVPLLIKRSDSIAGGAILDHCIVKITIDKEVVYQHSKYHIGELKIKEADDNKKANGYTHTVYRDGENMANFKSPEKAQRYIDFITGKSNKH